MRIHNRMRGLPLLGALLLLPSCSPPPPPPGAEILSSEEVGEALPGLGGDEVTRFRAGKVAFGSAPAGSGESTPTFGASSCGACHAFPVLGGSGGEDYPLPAPDSTVAGGCGDGASHGAGNAVAALWGRGLVEAVADGTLLALEDPDDVDRDGVSGRVGRDASGRIGRFGSKADLATLSDMAAGDDTVADFVRFLALPPRDVPSGEAERAQVTEGERLFHEVGCAVCHVPALPTGPGAVDALADKFAPLYSDLLLHELGDGRGVPCPGGASPTEFRTGILLGLGLRLRYMHDGATGTVQGAVARHGGEGARSRVAFDALPESERQAVVAFLLSL